MELTSSSFDDGGKIPEHRASAVSGFTQDELESEMEGHIIDSASIVGVYASNPRLA